MNDIQYRPFAQPLVNKLANSQNDIGKLKECVVNLDDIKLKFIDNQKEIEKRNIHIDNLWVD
jgi:hypothetical protein